MSRTIRANDENSRWYGGPDGRDGKPARKPNSEFKKMRRQQRRAREKRAIVEGKELPTFKKTDIWDCN